MVPENQRARGVDRGGLAELKHQAGNSRAVSAAAVDDQACHCGCWRIDRYNKRAVERGVVGRRS